MALTLETRATSTYRCDRYGRNCRYYRKSPWSNYGRWIVLAVLVGAAFLLFFLFACIATRRRRKQGRRPMYGTGWVPGQSKPQGGPMSNPSQPPQGGYQQGTQMYSQPPQTTGNQGYNQSSTSNQGYYGGQQTGVDLQQPSGTYQQPSSNYQQPAGNYQQPQYGGNPVYAPPSGPPPGKQ